MRTLFIYTLAAMAALYGCGNTVTVQNEPVTGTSPSPLATGRQSPQPVSPSPAASEKPASGADAECLANFDKFNVDKDTVVTIDEYVAGKWGQVRFIKAPTAEEEASMKAGFKAEAEKADANKDGRLTREEFKATCS